MILKYSLSMPFLSSLSRALDLKKRTRFVTFRWVLLMFILGFYGVTLLYVNAQFPQMHVDEGFQIELSRRPFWEITQVLTGDMHPPLYSYLLHFWLAIFGVGVFSARSFSILTSLASAVIFYRLLRHRLGVISALLGTGLFVSFPMVLVYGVVARNYALLLLALVSLLAYVYLNWSAPLTKRHLTGLIALQAVALYTHNLAIPLLAAGYVFFYLSRPSKARLKHYSLAALGTGLVFLPWAIVILNQLTLRSGEAGWVTFEPLADWHELASAVFPKLNGQKRFFAWGATAALYLFTLRVWRKKVTPYARTTAVILGLGILFLYLLSFAQPLFYDRYLLVTLPFLAYLVAHAFPTEFLRKVTVAGLLVLLNFGVFNYVAQDFRNGDFADAEAGVFATDKEFTTVFDLPTYYFHFRVLGYQNAYVFDPARTAPTWSGKALLRPSEYLSPNDLEGVTLVQYISQRDVAFEEYFADHGFEVVAQRDIGGREIYLFERR